MQLWLLYSTKFYDTFKIVFHAHPSNHNKRMTSVGEGQVRYHISKVVSTDGLRSWFMVKVCTVKMKYLTQHTVIVCNNTQTYLITNIDEWKHYGCNLYYWTIHIKLVVILFIIIVSRFGSYFIQSLKHKKMHTISCYISSTLNILFPF